MYWANLVFKVLLPIYPWLVSYVIYPPCHSLQRWLSSYQHCSNWVWPWLPSRSFYHQHSCGSLPWHWLIPILKGCFCEFFLEAGSLCSQPQQASDSPSSCLGLWSAVITHGYTIPGFYTLKVLQGWRMVQHLPSMCRDFDGIHFIANKLTVLNKRWWKMLPSFT